MQIVFATNNVHKLEEIRDILGGGIEVLSLRDIGCTDDIPETGRTLEENARQKARYVFERYDIDCFADDTGLEVAALDGKPGVMSARYAGGAGHDSEANMAKLLREMSQTADRRARFRTVIALMRHGHEPQTELFEGIVNGVIIREKRGSGGFGYDPLFVPDGFDKTFAELGEGVKNKISHRARAVNKLAEVLKRPQPRSPKGE